MERKGPEKPSDQLRRIIAESGLSRYELARQTGVDESALSRFMSGERGLTTDSIDKLAQCLGLELMAARPVRKRKKGR